MLIPYVQNVTLPDLPKTGVNPYDSIKNQVDLTYRAYYAKQELIEKNLKRHPREANQDYEYRKSMSYSLKKTAWSANFLTKTINNNRYKVIRTFSDSHQELNKLASNRIPSGKPWDAKLQEAILEALLGGVSYIYIDRNSIGPKMSSNSDLNEIKGYLGATILRVNQVSKIVQEESGFISQCQIIAVDDQKETISRYYIKDNISYFEVWQKPTNGTYEKIIEGVNDLKIAPIVPVLIRGELNDPLTITTPIQEIAPIDIDIMNEISSCKHAFSYHNFPILALPKGKGSIDSGYGIQSDLSESFPENIRGAVELNNQEDKVTLGAVQGIRFNKDEGVPLILEPDNNYVDKTLLLIQFLDSIIKDILGIGSETDHPLASGYAKSFSFHNTNETHNFIHSILENVEYQTWYLVSLMLRGSSIEDFQDFKLQVQINHPTNFDPTGGTSWQRLKEGIQSIAFEILSDELKKEVLKVFWTAALKDFRSPDHVENLFKNFIVKETINGSTKSNSSGKNNGGTGADQSAIPSGRTESKTTPAGQSTPI